MFVFQLLCFSLFGSLVLIPSLSGVHLLQDAFQSHHKILITRRCCQTPSILLVHVWIGQQLSLLGLHDSSIPSHGLVCVGVWW